MRPSKLPYCFAMMLCAMLGGLPASRGQTPAPPVQSPVDAGARIDALLTRVARENMPTEFSDTKDWGQQSDRFAGLEVERHGLKIETRRRRKSVNHGTWKKWSASIQDPANAFQLQIKNMHEGPDGKLMFEIQVGAELDVQARVAKWVKGVQLYSISASGHTDLRITIFMEMGVRLGSLDIPPDMILVPRATGSRIEINEFRIDRISKVGGEIAQQVSRHVESKLKDETAKQEKKIVEKLNGQFKKHESEYRLSLADAIGSKWTGLFGDAAGGSSGE